MTQGFPMDKWEDNIRLHIKEKGPIRGNELIMLKIGNIGEPLGMRNLAYGFHKTWS
jgi:hypothetical protein